MAELVKCGAVLRIPGLAPTGGDKSLCRRRRIDVKAAAAHNKTIPGNKTKFLLKICGVQYMHMLESRWCEILEE